MINIDEARVRVRAYFHHENKTGVDWRNTRSNWEQAEAEEKLYQVAPLSANVA